MIGDQSRETIARVMCPCEKHGYPTDRELQNVREDLEMLINLGLSYDLKQTVFWASHQLQSVRGIISARRS
jgi:hypothetical protein